MHKLQVCVGDRLLSFTTKQTDIRDWLTRRFSDASPARSCNKLGISGNLQVEILADVDTPFSGYDVEVRHSGGTVTFSRPDYVVEIDSSFQRATMHVHDTFSLKHALLNLYSTYIVHHRWGLMVHSSCVIENGKAHLFSGKSGAGKSTVARLSHPRPVLSDEASLLQIDGDQVRVFDSPFRSEVMPQFLDGGYPLGGVHMLHQDVRVSQQKMRPREALQALADKIFYWPHAPQDTLKALEMERVLAEAVPFYYLHFQKNDSFWEAIS